METEIKKLVENAEKIVVIQAENPEFAQHFLYKKALKSCWTRRLSVEQDVVGSSPTSLP